MPLSAESSRQTRFRNRYVSRVLRSRKPLAVIAAVTIALSALYNILQGIGQDGGPQTKVGAHPFAALCVFFLCFIVYRNRFAERQPPILFAVTGLLFSVLLAISLELVFPQLHDTMFGWTGHAVLDAFRSVSLNEFDSTKSITLTCIFASVLVRNYSSNWGLWLAVLAFAEVIAVIVSFGFNLEPLGQKANIGAFAALLSLTLAFLAAYAHRPILRVCLFADDVGRRSRNLLAAGFGLPWFAGFAMYAFQPENVPMPSATGYVVVALMLSMVAVVMYSGLKQEQSDKARRSAERRLKTLLTQDALTQTLNRRGAMLVIAQRWKVFEETGKSTGVILIDLDRFKAVNDTFGHQIGDQVLAKVGDALRPHLRRDDHLCRWGGEEFLAIVEEDEADLLVWIGDRMRSALHQIDGIIRRESGIDLQVRGSFGISRFEKDDQDPEDALRRADLAMYHAKDTGRDRAVLFDPVLDRRTG